LRYPVCSLIRGGEGGSFSVHRVPFGIQGPCRYAGRVELAFMLPGFRFLVAAIVLSMSILVFGLGAAALLRAAHEEVASRPSWRAAPETVFAQQNNDGTQPVLAMLRLEPAAAQNPPDPVVAVDAPAEPIASAPAEPERIASLKPESSPPAEPAAPEMPVPEIGAQGNATPPQADAPAPAAESRIAATEAASPANEVAVVVPEPASTLVAQGSDITLTKIATLGGPPVIIEPQPSTKNTDAKPDRSAIKKRQQARRAAHRRKLALQARTAQQAPLQPAAAGFNQPTITVRNR